jgi:hypothetical protein
MGKLRPTEYISQDPARTTETKGNLIQGIGYTMMWAERAQPALMRPPKDQEVRAGSRGKTWLLDSKASHLGKLGGGTEGWEGCLHQQVHLLSSNIYSVLMDWTHLEARGPRDCCPVIQWQAGKDIVLVWIPIRIRWHSKLRRIRAGLIY